MKNEDISEIIFKIIPGKIQNLGSIQLNRPESLNALSHDMCRRLRNQLQAWSQDPSIKAVIIQSTSERAFCAGGDIRSLYRNAKANVNEAAQFFHDEYAMNKTIFHFKKPYIAFLDGITMGGGAGISIHGSHRLATERFLFAMPETGIGFFPDVGAGYFLSRLPDFIGIYLGLTGHRIGAMDAKWLGLVTSVIDREQQENIIEALASCEFAKEDKAAVSDIINSFVLPTAEAPLKNHLSAIRDIFSRSTIEKMLFGLEKLNTEWSKQTISALLSKSPTSLKVTLLQLQRALMMDFDRIMEMELNIAISFLHGADFLEGIRAQVIDKDKNPKWHPDQLQNVTTTAIEEFFQFKMKL